MIRFFLVTSLCFFSGCGFLDEDLLLDDEEFEESLSGGSSGYGYGHGRVSSRCGSSVRMGKMSMGVPKIVGHGTSTFGVYQLDSDNIEGRLYDAELSAAENNEPVIEQVFEDWHAEFLRAEEEWLRADIALVQRDDKALGN